MPKPPTTSGKPSADKRYLGPDGRPLVLTDDTVNPRTLKWFKQVL